MRTLVDNFNRTFPSCKASSFCGSISVIEPQNLGNGKLYKVEFVGIDGFSFQHELAAQMSSFATKAGHLGVLCKDCDGILLFEYDGQKYILFSELKSKFSTQEIIDAKDQIIGSYLKFRGVASVLQNFDLSVYKVIGVISSFEPNYEQISAISKKDSPVNSFCIRLNNDGKIVMSASSCGAYFTPLNVPEFTFYYVPVKDMASVFSVNIPSLLSRT